MCSVFKISFTLFNKNLLGMKTLIMHEIIPDIPNLPPWWCEILPPFARISSLAEAYKTLNIPDLHIHLCQLTSNDFLPIWKKERNFNLHYIGVSILTIDCIKVKKIKRNDHRYKGSKRRCPFNDSLNKILLGNYFTSISSYNWTGFWIPR